MLCPECASKMDYQDASAPAMYKGGPSVIAVTYYCIPCASYYRWERGLGLRSADWGHGWYAGRVGREQLKLPEPTHYDETVLRRIINRLMDITSEL